MISILANKGERWYERREKVCWVGKTFVAKIKVDTFAYFSNTEFNPYMAGCTVLSIQVMMCYFLA